MAKSKRNLEAEIDDLREEVSMLNTMPDSLSDVLAEKGVITQADWEKKIKEKPECKMNFTIDASRGSGNNRLLLESQGFDSKAF